MWTDDHPPVLFYYFRLPFQTDMDAIRIHSNPSSRLLKVWIEQEDNDLDVRSTRSTLRLCHLPSSYHYDYQQLRVRFLKENFIRIELPTTL